MQVNIEDKMFSLVEILILPCQVIFKSFANSYHHLRSLSLEWQEKPEDWDVVDKTQNWGLRRFLFEKIEKPEEEVDYLDSTENGETSEKAHGASYQTQLRFHCHL